jgi:hypothetical protein
LPDTCTPTSTCCLRRHAVIWSDGIVERTVENDDARIDLQRLAVRVEGRVQRFDAPIRAKLAFLRGLDLELSADLAFEAEAAHLQVVAEVELQVERHRDLSRPRAGRRACRRRSPHPRRASACVPGRARSSRGRRASDPLSDRRFSTICASPLPEVTSRMLGRCSSAKLFGAPGQARAALGEPQRQGAARRELALAALDGELLPRAGDPFRAQRAARRPSGTRPRAAPRARSLPTQRARHDRLAERAAALQVRGKAAFDALVGEKGAGPWRAGSTSRICATNATAERGVMPKRGAPGSGVMSPFTLAVP